MFSVAGRNHAFLETTNRSNCIFLASTFEEPCMKWWKTEHKNTVAFSFKERSSIQVPSFIPPSTTLSRFVCKLFTMKCWRSCRICPLLTAGIHDLHSTTSFWSSVFQSTVVSSLADFSRVWAVTERDLFHVSNHYSYRDGGHWSAEQAKSSTGMSPSVCSDPQGRQELSKAGN